MKHQSTERDQAMRMRNKKRGYREMLEIFVLNSDVGLFTATFFDVGIYDKGEKVSNAACLECLQGNIALSMIEMVYGLDDIENPYNWVDHYDCPRVAYDALRMYRKLRPDSGPMPRF